jgi:hypothetical protein
MGLSQEGAKDPSQREEEMLLEDYKKEKAER